MGSHSMKALRLVQYGAPYKLEDIPIPTISDDQLLVKVEAAGFCHTDHQIYNGVYKSPLPLTPSHEPAGTIVAVGKNVTGRWEPGQRIGMLNFRGACHACVGCDLARDPLRPDKPDTRFCENNENAGVNADGAFAEYIVADPATSVLLPEGVSFEQAAPLMCAGATVWTSLKDAGVDLNLPIGVIGVGGLGYLALQFAAGLGHPTIAIDNRLEGRQLASELPDHLQPGKVVDYNSPHATKEVVGFAGGGGLGAVLVCTDSVDATEWSLKLLRPHGVCVPLGLPVEGFKFSACDLVFKELVIRGSLVANQRLLSDMMKFVAEKGLRSYVKTVKLEEAMDLPDQYMDPHLKGRLVVVP
ncbi:alcohol dehydrogenase GroES-like domain-containing protein [Aspergillus violaceofuscus CBS 115571]|uniref:Alcohol dehydrogenase GroES-like domain-containing protein n=1 Tax=Aspergillus violaceofuscus (strain CBS 115571) TaxID=1450538 RepID=A0A2V5ILQ5_ASPV1|nr:alcohol dehydrogenase GroES-like domain-containing protein [Aspergillus violaceofuscus CBS 115571]